MSAFLMSQNNGFNAFEQCKFTQTANKRVNKNVALIHFSPVAFIKYANHY